MEPNTMVTLAKMGAAAALGIAAMGSALGCGTAGMSAITMWKKAYAQGKSALFTLLVFVGAPISQTIYGMLLMNFILSKAAESGFTNWGGCLAGGSGQLGGVSRCGHLRWHRHDGLCLVPGQVCCSGLRCSR